MTLKWALMHRLSLLHVGILTKAMAWLQLLKGSTVYLEPQVVFIYNAIDLKSAGAHYRLTTPSSIRRQQQYIVLYGFVQYPYDIIDV
jgi:hypothetical protein